ncbi:MAG TPA: hypothetical protein VFN90_02515, partial [Gemmatimonadales bacterium]|nr:hypothetical protein [Gemmatimonadales bacterium]
MAIRGVDVGIDQADLGDVTVLRVDLAPGETVNEGVEARQAHVRKRQARLGLVMGVLTLATVAFLVRSWLSPDADAWDEWHILTTPLLIFAAASLSAARRRRRLGFPSLRSDYVMAGLCFAGAATLSAQRPTGGIVALGLFAVPAILFATMDRWLPVGRIRLPSGLRLWIRREELDFSRIGIGDDGTLRLTLPSGRHLDREDSEAMLRDLLDGLSWEGTGEMQRAGFAIA